MESTDVLSELFSDPEKLSAAVSAVSSMLGGERRDEAPKLKLPEKRSDSAELIRALRPFLSPERRARADRAIRLLTLAELMSGMRDIW